jgi:cell division protease FtsH
VLLSGPPGVGKTLLARAIAGEANVNFFPITGSEFVEMYVGVGASRIRDLFNTAKKFAPAIIFIDEVDSLGKRQAGSGDSAGQEYRQTLNQLLAEMDGFDPLSGILVIFASNFPELIDLALRRKGRIDSEIKIPLPSLEGRKEILMIHLREQIRLHVLDTDVDIDELANKTYNFSGADLANFANEAVLAAAEKEKDKVSKADFDEAFDKIVLGLAGKPVGKLEERKKIAIHETGHLLVSRLLPELKKLRMQVASILRRADSHGVVQLIEEGDIHSLTPKEFTARICFYLGGMVAEKVVFGFPSSDAGADLRNATLTARAMIRDSGMSKLGPIVIPDKTGNWRDEISEAMLRDFEMEEMALLKECERRTEELLGENEQMLRAFADVLVLKEEMREREIDNWMDEFNKLHSQAA